MNHFEKAVITLLMAQQAFLHVIASKLAPELEKDLNKTAYECTEALKEFIGV